MLAAVGKVLMSDVKAINQGFPGTSQFDTMGGIGLYASFRLLPARVYAVTSV